MTRQRQLSIARRMVDNKFDPSNYSFEYPLVPIKALQVSQRQIEGGNGKTKTVSNIVHEGREIHTSNRFWYSLQGLYGFSQNIFHYFSHKEVFDRISERSNKDEIRLCIESNHADIDTDESDIPNGVTLLANSNPNKATIRYDDIIGLLDKHKPENLHYHGGLITSRHFPAGNSHDFKIGNDQFEDRFALDTPIDGYGNPSTYLMMIRLLCANGAIGLSAAFKSDIALGKRDGTFALNSALESFNNEDGYIALRNRYESAQTSFASLAEANRLYKMLVRQASRGELNLSNGMGQNKPAANSQPMSKSQNGDGASLMDKSVLGSFHRMVGDIGTMYGVASFDSLPAKRQRALPAKCTMYNLLNFATELSTHHASGGAKRELEAFHGDVISTEYDLEGMATETTDWSRFLVSNDAASEAKMESSRR